jgi:hypothetical protein
LFSFAVRRVPVALGKFQVLSAVRSSELSVPVKVAAPPLAGARVSLSAFAAVDWKTKFPVETEVRLPSEVTEVPPKVMVAPTNPVTARNERSVTTEARDIFFWKELSFMLGVSYDF